MASRTYVDASTASPLGVHVGRQGVSGVLFGGDSCALPSLHKPALSDAVADRGPDHEVEGGHRDDEQQRQYGESEQGLPLRLNLQLSDECLAHGVSSVRQHSTPVIGDGCVMVRVLHGERVWLTNAQADEFVAVWVFAGGTVLLDHKWGNYRTVVLAA